MPLPSLTFVLFVALTVVFVAAAIAKSPMFLWFAAVCSWVFSFMAAFSYGLYLLVSTFVLVSLAAASALGKLRRPAHAVIAVVLGVIFWAIAIRLVDDYWLFLPFALLEPVLS